MKLDEKSMEPPLFVLLFLAALCVVNVPVLTLLFCLERALLRA